MSIDTQLAPSPDKLKDEELMRQVITGDQQAFAILVQRYRPLIFRQALQILKDYDLAEDVTQTVCLQLHLSHPQPKVSLRAWLLRVVYTRSIDEIRKQRREQHNVLFSKVPNIMDNQALPEEIAENHDLQQAIQRAIEQLPPKFRSIFKLRCEDQLTYPEIERLLSIPSATAKSYFKRARQLLQKSLIEEL